MSKLEIYLLWCVTIILSILCYIISINILLHASSIFEKIVGFMTNNSSLLFLIWFSQKVIGVLHD